MNLNRYLIIISIILGILLIPLITMQFTDEVNWGLFDFVLAAVLLFMVGVVLNYMVGKVSSTRSRIIIIVFILILFMLIWAELAVGIFGTPFSGD